MKGEGVDGRNYDYIGLADVVDFLFIMGYDEQSQVFGDCEAAPNAGLMDTVGGVMAYVQLGIQPSKLVLGMPWYGYQYHCLEVLQNWRCVIDRVSFRGVNCSDAAGTQLPYSKIAPLIEKYGGSWDEHSNTKYSIYDVS